MRSFFVFALPVVLGACASSGPTPPAPRQPSSETASLILPNTAIRSVILLEGQTGCQLDRIVKQRGNHVIYHNTCVTSIPFSMEVKNETLKIDEIFEGQHNITISGLMSKVDLANDPGQVAKFHAENQARAKTYFNDLSGGCMGTDVILKVGQNRNLKSIDTNDYFGEQLCKARKAYNKGEQAVVGTFSNAENQVKSTSAAITNHYNSIKDRVNEMRAGAQDYVADSLKGLAENVASEKNQTGK